MDPLIRMTKIDSRGTITKEYLFNWIVDLDQDSFDALCNEIISLYNFQETFEGALVSEEEDMLKPWLAVLPKIVFSVDEYGCNYQKRHFYRLLSGIGNEELNNMCNEILSLYTHARANNNTYIISQVYPAVAGLVEFWRVHYKPQILFANLSETIMRWQSMMILN
jgi:hypothetical protein